MDLLFCEVLPRLNRFWALHVLSLDCRATLTIPLVGVESRDQRAAATGKELLPARYAQLHWFQIRAPSANLVVVCNIQILFQYLVRNRLNCRQEPTGTAFSERSNSLLRCTLRISVSDHQTNATRTKLQQRSNDASSFQPVCSNGTTFIGCPPP